jgi:hypothetical protein
MKNIEINLADLLSLFGKVSIGQAHYEENQRTNRNGRVTSVTPTPEFDRLRPYERNIDKSDEQSTLLWHIKKKHKTDASLQAMAKEIRETSQTLDRLIGAMKTAKDEPLAELQEQFRATKARNYALIDEGALKIFGDCGFGGAFSDAIQVHLVKQFSSGKLKGPAMYATVGRR